MTDVLHYPAPEGPENRLLLVMLPGVGIEAAAFFDHGMVGAVQAHGREQKLGIDVAAPRPELELYLDGEISQFYVPGMKDSVPFNFGAMFGLVEKATP